MLTLFDSSSSSSSSDSEEEFEELEAICQWLIIRNQLLMQAMVEHIANAENPRQRQRRRRRRRNRERQLFNSRSTNNSVHPDTTILDSSLSPTPSSSPPLIQQSMAETPTPIKFGIMGGATIARKVSRAINLSPNSVLYAIASRSVEKAAKFAKDNAFPESAKIYGSYDALLDDPDVDVVYMPLPTSLHIKWAVLAARKKKHILLEKPVALNAAEFDVILEACESSGVQIMDSTMWMHHPRTAKMEEFLSDPSRFGELKFVNSTFSFAADKDFLENDIRVKPDLDALGALGDAGWYCVRVILFAAGYHLPKSVVALHDAVLNSAGVIISCSASMEWEDGRTATFHCSFMENLTMDATVLGTNGALRLHDFIVPYEENKASFSAVVNPGPKEDGEWEPKPGEEIVVATELPQEALMVSELSRLVASIKLEGAKPEKKWPTISRKTQLVLDAVKASIDKGYQTIEIES